MIKEPGQDLSRLLEIFHTWRELKFLVFWQGRGVLGEEVEPRQRSQEDAHKADHSVHF